MQVFTEEFKEAATTMLAKCTAYTIVFGPIIALTIFAFWFEAYGG